VLIRPICLPPTGGKIWSSNNNQYFFYTSVFSQKPFVLMFIVVCVLMLSYQLL
jgi:hypothetical protein